MSAASNMEKSPVATVITPVHASGFGASASLQPDTITSRMKRLWQEGMRNRAYRKNEAQHELPLSQTYSDARVEEDVKHVFHPNGLEMHWRTATYKGIRCWCLPVNVVYPALRSKVRSRLPEGLALMDSSDVCHLWFETTCVDM